MLKRIKKACTKEEYNQRRSFFKSLEGAIRYGDFIFLSDIYCHNDYDYEIERWGEGEKGENNRYPKGERQRVE